MNRYQQAATVADALSLGPHWVYNQGKLARIYPDGVHEFSDPRSSYHPNRKAGQLTHYGDQMQLLEKSLQARGGFDSDGWCADWLAGMADYDGYVDGATSETLAVMGAHPSASDDLAGASRLAPILDLNVSAEEKIAAARAQTVLTHGDASVADAAEFFVRAALALEQGSSLEDALRAACGEGSYTGLEVGKKLEEALAGGDDYLAVSRELGLTCHTSEAFPLAGTDHLLTREADTDYVVNLVQVWASRVLANS